MNRLLIILFLIYNTGCVSKEIKLSKKLLIECRVESSSKSILLNNLFKDLKILERKNKSNLINIKEIIKEYERTKSLLNICHKNYLDSKVKCDKYNDYIRLLKKEINEFE